MEELRCGVPRPVPMETVVLRRITHLVTQNDELGEIRDAAIRIKGNVIEWIGKDADLPSEPPADKEIDMEGCIVIPGMVNTHAHMFQSVTRCIAQDKQLHGWLKSLYPIWEHMTPTDMRAAVRASMAELLLGGCTTSCDHAYFWPNGCKLDDVVACGREMGLRLTAIRGSMSVGVSKGGIAPDSCVEEEEDILKDCERVIRELHDNSRFSMTRIALGPSSQKVVSTDLMAASARLAREHPGVRLHTHMAENDEDIVYTHKRYGHGFREYIAGVGWDKDDCWFAHCVKLNKDEIGWLAGCGCGIAHCAASNTRLASGICPVRGMLDAGLNVGLGVDGAASSDCLVMLAEARMAMLLQRAGGDPKGLSAREALRLATRGGAVNLGREAEIGQLAPGFAADIAAWRVTGNLAFAGAAHDPVAGLLLCAQGVGRPCLVVVNGEVVVQEGRLLSADERAIVADACAASARLCAGVGPEVMGTA